MKQNSEMEDQLKNTAEIIREECIREFIRAYEEAGIKGLCEEGRIEYALDAVRSIELSGLWNKKEGQKK